MKRKMLATAASAAVVLTGCGSSTTTTHHNHAAAASGVPAASPSPRAVINTALDKQICKTVGAWLPAWSYNPPQRLISDGTTAQGSLGTDLSFFLANLQQQSTGGFLGVKQNCAALGVKLKLGPPPTLKCWHRYRRWQDGSVKYEIASIGRSLSDFSKYSNSNLYAAVTFLDIAASAAKLAKTWPIPACADPDGYWHTYLTAEHKVASDAGSPSLVASLGYMPQSAINDQQNAQTAFNSLASELVQTTGHHPFG